MAESDGEAPTHSFKTLTERSTLSLGLAAMIVTGIVGLLGLSWDTRMSVTNLTIVTGALREATDKDSATLRDGLRELRGDYKGLSERMVRVEEALHFRHNETGK